MTYGTLIMNDGTKVLVEVERPKRDRGHLSEKGVVKDLEEHFSKIMEIVGEIAKNAHTGYQSIPESAKPKEFELSFGIKLNAEAGIVFSKMGCEGSFQVNLRWK